VRRTSEKLTAARSDLKTAISEGNLRAKALTAEATLARADAEAAAPKG
jgi:hypothetical protein